VRHPDPVAPPPAAAAAARSNSVRRPKVGFVSLGCPKALVDSERILTRLRAEGYTSSLLRGRQPRRRQHLRLHHDAVHESLDAIGEALARNER